MNSNNYRFYPISEMQKLNGFNLLSTNMILRYFKEIEDVLRQNDYVLSKEEWQFLSDVIKQRFFPVTMDNDLNFLMTCFLYDVAYIIDYNNDEKTEYIFEPKNEIQMISYVINKKDKYDKLYNTTNDIHDNIKSAFVNEMKLFFNDNYTKLQHYFHINREQAEKFDYNDWFDFLKDINLYNNELRFKNLPRLKFNRKNNGKEIREAHRPTNITQIQQIDAKTNEIIKVYKSIKEIIELNDNFTKSGLSKALSGKRSKYKGFIWKT